MIEPIQIVEYSGERNQRGPIKYAIGNGPYEQTPIGSMQYKDDYFYVFDLTGTSVFSAQSLTPCLYRLMALAYTVVSILEQTNMG